jgi:hypothetical protein
VPINLWQRTTIKFCKANNLPVEKLWQRNYYEHIIRDEDDYFRIVDYIENNPIEMGGRPKQVGAIHRGKDKPGVRTSHYPYGCPNGGRGRGTPLWLPGLGQGQAASVPTN